MMNVLASGHVAHCLSFSAALLAVLAACRLELLSQPIERYVDSDESTVIWPGNLRWLVYLSAVLAVPSPIKHTSKPSAANSFQR